MAQGQQFPAPNEPIADLTRGGRITRSWLATLNSLWQLAHGGTVTGSGTAGRLARWLTSSSLTDALAAASSRLLGSGASGSGAPYSELTLGTNLSMSGTTLNAASGGGTVTHTAGALALNELVVGNALADLKTVAATDGQIPIGKTSDGSVTLATLTAGANITITNAPAGITIASTGGGGGGWTLLATKVASASASLDFTGIFTSTYNEYVFEMEDLVPATASTNLLFRVSTDGGATYVSTSTYSFAAWAMGIGGSGNFVNGSTTSIALVGFSNLSNLSTKPVTATLTWYNPLSSAVHKTLGGLVHFFDAAGPNLAVVMLSGSYMATTPADACQFFMSSGNIATGTIRCYGVAK